VEREVVSIKIFLHPYREAPDAYTAGLYAYGETLNAFHPPLHAYNEDLYR